MSGYIVRYWRIFTIYLHQEKVICIPYIYKEKKSYVLSAHSFFIYIFRVMILVVQLPMLVVRAETSLAHLHHVIEFRPQDR